MIDIMPNIQSIFRKNHVKLQNLSFRRPLPPLFWLK